MYFKMLRENNALSYPPAFIESNMVLEAMVGSHGYGTNGPGSDMDIMGVCVPPRKLAFPYIYNDVMPDFGSKPETFDQYSPKRTTLGEAEYEIKVYNIRELFNQAMANNPRQLEFIFSHDSSITYETTVGRMIRDNKRLFLHKGFFHKFVSFGESQLRKMDRHKEAGVRAALHEKYGFDTKFASHCIRLILESEQILESGDLDLKKHGQLLRSIREGSIGQDEIVELFNEKKAKCESLFVTSQLPERPNELLIREFMFQCCEQHWKEHE